MKIRIPRLWPRFRRARPALHWQRVRRIGLVLAFGWFALVMMLGIVIHAYGLVDRTRPADVIIVLGAGLRPDGSPGPALTRRSTHAADLWQQGYAPQIICAGGTPGQITIRSEADACAAILREQGVPTDAIILEDQSRSTEENAIESKQIMDAGGWRTALLVSDGFHMLRAQWIFSYYGLDISPAPVTDARPPLFEYLLAILREIVALHWLALKVVFNLPITYVKSI
ncbi:MAG: YdcF family protein [Chloroflexi bacterium]|nr:YdcF family protein [Chloroflexota bacterium]